VSRPDGVLKSALSNSPGRRPGTDSEGEMGGEKGSRDRNTENVTALTTIRHWRPIFGISIP
jgi:hypothetical protein